MRCHYLAVSILFFIISIDYSIPYLWSKSSFDTLPVLNTPDWDVLIFTQQWPVTVCREWKDRDPNHKCLMPDNPNTWTIHGIWPTKLHTKGPSFCNKTWPFDNNLIQPIENELRSVWKNIESGTSENALWAHEWSKHGTCAAVLPALNNELKYFSKGLDWFRRYNMTNVLESHKVYPSNDKKYLVKDLFQMLNMNFGVTPMIQCRREHGANWLSEIRVCFDKSLNLKDCDGVMTTRPRTIELENGVYIKTLTNCIIDEPVLYPKSDPLVDQTSLLVQLNFLLGWLQWITL